MLKSTYIGFTLDMVVIIVVGVIRSPIWTLETPAIPEMGAVTVVQPRFNLALSRTAWPAFASAVPAKRGLAQGSLGPVLLRLEPAVCQAGTLAPPSPHRSLHCRAGQAKTRPP